MLRRIRLLAVVVALVSTASRAAEVKRAAPLQLTLPPVCYAVVGVPMNVYYDNIVLTEKPEDYRFQFQCDLGTEKDRCWTVTPVAGDVGDHPLSVSASDSSRKVLQQAKPVLHVAPADAGAGRAIRLLIIGQILQ